MDISVVSETVRYAPVWAFALLGGALGAIFGSYFATLFIRWPAGISASAGRSRCDGCGRRLSVLELVPVASFLLAKGKCRTCAQAINPAHLLLEVLCAATGAFLFAAGSAALAPMVWLLCLLALFDAAYLWLPNRLVTWLAIVAILSPPWIEGTSIEHRLIGGLAGLGALWLVATAFKRFTGREGLGGGDPKLFGAIGLWAGFVDLPKMMLVACAVGLIDFVVRTLMGCGGRSLKLPLGTYLSIATIFFALLKLTAF